MQNNAEDSEQIKRIRQWIERLEGKAVELLDGLALEEMTPKHQADVALKCLDHVQRFTAIEKKLQDDSHTNDKQDLLAKFMREARGEYSTPAEENSVQIKEDISRRKTEGVSGKLPRAQKEDRYGCEKDELAKNNEIEQIEGSNDDGRSGRMEERYEGREEEEDLWLWLDQLELQALEEGKDLWHWLDQLENGQQEDSWSEEEEVSQAERERWLWLDQLEEEASQTARERWLWLDQLEDEWQENTRSDDEAYEEEESWLNNGWWLDEEEPS